MLLPEVQRVRGRTEGMVVDLPQQPHAEGCEDMSVNITSDMDADRMMSLRASSLIPLPPEISLCEPKDAREDFGWLTYYEFYGVSQHPIVELLGRRRLDAAMASAVSKAQHLDRVSHYGAWLGRETVRIEDLTHPVNDDPEGKGEDS